MFVFIAGFSRARKRTRLHISCDTAKFASRKLTRDAALLRGLSVERTAEIVKGSEMDRMARERASYRGGNYCGNFILRELFVEPSTTLRKRLALRGMFISVISASFF